VRPTIPPPAPEEDTVLASGRRSTSQRRKYPLAKPGDELGVFRVVRQVQRDGTCNERVEVVCENGHVRTGYVFNLRNAKRCPECKRAPPDPVEQRRNDQFGRLALILGYNELAKNVERLGEKVYCRLLVGRLHEEYIANGGVLEIKEGEQVLVTLRENPPYINLYPRDIDLMRKAIAEHEAKTKGEG
jgi:hypothetical protein